MRTIHSDLRDLRSLLLLTVASGLALSAARAHAACPPVMQSCSLGPPLGDPSLGPELGVDSLSTWPVRARDDNADNCQGEEITAIWNSFGEYQDYNTHYGHTGIDIRSNPSGGGDLAVVAADAYVWAVAQFQDDVCEEAHECRIYAKSYPNQRHIYYYAHLWLSEGSPVDQDTRSAIINAVSNGPDDESDPQDRAICEGNTLAQIGPFNSGRSHLHFAIFDSEDNYNGVNPLVVIDEPHVDVEPPEILDFRFVTCTETENTNCQEVAVTEGCSFGTQPLTGTVDLLTQTRDTFHLDPDDGGPLSGGTESIGVYRGAYRVRRMPDGNENDGTLFGGTWYEFDRLPFLCRGEDVSGCTQEPDATNATPIDQAKFLELVDFPTTGPELGITFFGYIFSVWGSFDSKSPYGTDTEELHYSIPTRRWGLQGSWDTTQQPDGLYQVSVYVWDESGLYDWEDHYVVVKNDPGPLPATADVTIRDHMDDTGAVPSNPNGEKHWRSPDIKVVPAGFPVPDADDAWWYQWSPVDLEADTDYEVFLRVRNLGCEPATGVAGRVAFAEPSMWNASWQEIGPLGGVAQGAPLASGDAVVLGPFPWTPTALDAGHKCIKARLTANGDPATAALGEISAGHVQNDNNIGQLNVKIFNQPGDMGFSFSNPTPGALPIALEIDAQGFPLELPGAQVSLEVEHHPALAAAWTGVPLTTLVDDGITLRLTIHSSRVTMPAAVIPAGTLLDASAELVLPPSAPIGVYDVDFFETVDGVVAGGMTVTEHNLTAQ